MTRIDFYILPGSEQPDRLLFLCRLVAKAYKQQHRVYIHTDDEATSKSIDELLWSHQAESFIPHHLSTSTAPPAAITIGHSDECLKNAGHHNDVIINLATEIPNSFSRFERCIEIVIQQPHVLEITRNHFGFYRERGYPLNTHDRRKVAK